MLALLVRDVCVWYPALTSAPLKDAPEGIKVSFGFGCGGFGASYVRFL